MADENDSREPAAGCPAIAWMALLLALVSCATVQDGPLGFRILPVEKRYDFVQVHGSEVSPDIRNAFMEGEVVPGMAREWVLQLYGRPDRISDRSWEYFDGKGKAVLEVFFERDVVDSVYMKTGPRVKPVRQPAI